MHPHPLVIAARSSGVVDSAVPPVRWSRVDRDDCSLEVFEVSDAPARCWSFIWPERLVIQAASDGVYVINGAEHEATLPAGAVLVVEPLSAHVRVRTERGAAFRVIFGTPSPPDGDGSSRSPQVRVRAPARGPVCDARAPASDVYRRALASTTAAPPFAGRIDGRVARTREYIESNLERNFDLDTLAISVKLNRCHLCRIFEREIGMPPLRFRAHLRIARARHLLASGVDCTEAAFAIGYCDQSHFSRAFREITGTTPSAYSRACRAPTRRRDFARAA
ncbi:helix-turn-helix domain-containing protein [Sandaracinus amylolyticus]|uniref:helix-turn-helix domain-containing protein n=1 Tax=Sandaracinus amylolyticus TaxID=927083 RepID=UPI001F1F3C90|nr:AraC family transcriptional regulator [Sandaracinus amylolyticus]UJR83645.1 Hypothetical protein I5071_57140 [Sandaracinus amylolyticus]